MDLGNALFSHGFRRAWSQDGTGRAWRDAEFRPWHDPSPHTEGPEFLEEWLLRYGATERSGADITDGREYGVAPAAQPVFGRFELSGPVDLNGQRPSAFTAESGLVLEAAMKDAAAGGWFLSELSFNTAAPDRVAPFPTKLEADDFARVYLGQLGRSHDWWTRFGVRHDSADSTATVRKPQPHIVGVPDKLAKKHPWNWTSYPLWLNEEIGMQGWADFLVQHGLAPVRAEVAREDYGDAGASPDGLAIVFPARYGLPAFLIWDALGRPQTEAEARAILAKIKPA